MIVVLFGNSCIKPGNISAASALGFRRSFVIFRNGAVRLKSTVVIAFGVRVLTSKIRRQKSSAVAVRFFRFAFNDILIVKTFGFRFRRGFVCTLSLRFRKILVQIGKSNLFRFIVFNRFGRLYGGRGSGCNGIFAGIHCRIVLFGSRKRLRLNDRLIAQIVFILGNQFIDNGTRIFVIILALLENLTTKVRKRKIFAPASVRLFSPIGGHVSLSFETFQTRIQRGLFNRKLTVTFLLDLADDIIPIAITGIQCA